MAATPLSTLGERGALDLSVLLLSVEPRSFGGVTCIFLTDRKNSRSRIRFIGRRFSLCSCNYYTRTRAILYNLYIAPQLLTCQFHLILPLKRQSHVCKTVEKFLFSLSCFESLLSSNSFILLFLISDIIKYLFQFIFIFILLRIKFHAITFCLGSHLLEHFFLKFFKIFLCVVNLLLVYFLLVNLSFYIHILITVWSSSC